MDYALHAIIIKKNIPLKIANKRTFRSKIINPNITLVFGKLQE
jgi:hypothetical protein